MTVATGATRVDRAAPRVGRHERFAAVGSTNDVVRGWLAAGEPEICLAVADEQTAGRGRNGRTWTAPSGTSLLLSLGFRPIWLAPDRAWRLAAAASLAMAEAGEAVADVPAGTILLKWPNDLVVAVDPAHGAHGGGEAGGEATGLRKLAGVLGETDGLGTDDPRAVVGLGVNVDWRRVDVPAELATSMTSLRDAAGDRPIDARALLAAFLTKLETRVAELHAGRFDADAWTSRQATAGREIELSMPDGKAERVTAVSVDGESGALRVRDRDSGRERAVLVGEIRHVRLAAV